jgi:uncharacterized small protein (DUF1192 family)
MQQEIKASPQKIIMRLQELIGIQAVRIAVLESEIERLMTQNSERVTKNE